MTHDFSKEINTFIQQVRIKLMVFYWTFYSSWILKKNIINKKCLEHQISILQWFVKDHVTLKIQLSPFHSFYCIFDP